MDSKTRSWTWTTKTKQEEAAGGKRARLARPRAAPGLQLFAVFACAIIHCTWSILHK